MSSRRQWATYMSLGVLGLLALWVLYDSYTSATPAVSAEGGFNWSWLSYSIVGIPLHKILLAGIAALVLLRLFKWWFPASSGASGSPGKSIKRVATVLSAFAALNIALYLIDPTAPLYNTPEGYGHLAFYVVLAIIAAMIDANLEGKAKFVAFVMLFITFALIGPRTGMLLSPDGRLWTKLHLKLPSWGDGQSFREALVPSPAPTTSGCSGVPATETYQPGVHNVNGNFCQLRAYVISGCVTWLDVNKEPLAKTCNGPMPSVPNIINMRAESVAVVRLNHCRNYASGNLVDVCG